MTHFATGLKHWARTALASVVSLFLPAKPSQQVRTAEPVTEDEQLTTTRNRKDSLPKPAEVPALDVVAPINCKLVLLGLLTYVRLELDLGS
jgi:hypothetical protein